MDESFWVLAGLLALGWVVVLPVVTLVMASRARAEAERANEGLRALSLGMDTLRKSLLHPAAPTIPVDPVAPPRPIPSPPQPIPSPSPSPSPNANANANADPPVPMAELVPAPAPKSAGKVRSAARPESPAPESSLEERIALVWFTRIGALALLLGIAYFFKYAVDNAWIGPLGRIALGAVAGVGLLLFGEQIRPRAQATYVWVLLGVGLSFLYFSAYASFAFYHLVPMPLAFGAIFVITLLGGALALHHDAEPILVLSLLGGFACPVLLSTGEDRLGGLAVYLCVLTSLAATVALRRRFQASLALAMLGTVALLLGWYERFFHIAEGPYAPLSGRILPLAVVSLFVVQWGLFYAVARRSPVKFPRTPLLLAALCLGHLGYALVLPDSPVALGAVLAGLAVVGVYVLGREDRRDLLGVPLSLAFLVLALTVREKERPARAAR